MASSAERRRAQRALARKLRAGRKTLPKSVTEPAKRKHREYLDDVLSGREKEPKDKRTLASAAGKASWGKAPTAYETAWSKYWYHNRDHYNEDTGEYEYDKDEFNAEGDDDE